MKSNTKKLTSVAILMALTVVMQFVSGMLPPIGGFSLSLVLIPIVLGAALHGASVGALLGATFGAVVFINCVTGADPGGAMVFQANPFLCFLVVMGKGTLAGLCAGLVYKLFKDKNGYLAMLFAAIVCPVVNTGTFIVCMFTLFKDVLAAWAGGSNVVTYVLTGLVLANFVPELIINIVVCPASQRIVKMRGR